MTTPRQAAIDALAEADHGYQHLGREPMSECPFREDFIRRAARIIDYLDAHPEAAAALRAYLGEAREQEAYAAGRLAGYEDGLDLDHVADLFPADSQR